MDVFELWKIAAQAGGKHGEVSTPIENGVEYQRVMMFSDMALLYFADAISTAEREECAKTCERNDLDLGYDPVDAALSCAGAIRARSTIPEQAPNTGAPHK